MWNKQIILLLCMLWIGGSAARSFRPTSFDYDYREDSRKASNSYRVRSATTTTPRPSLQHYWESFVSNIPTLPPFRWNVTNSFGNLFNNGAQEIIETPVAMHQMMEEPNRRRKSSKRKLSTKKNKNRKRAQSRDHSSYYNYQTPTYQENSGYQQQIQLQPLGVDQSNIMHFYEPKTGNYYAMQMLTPSKTQYNHNSNNYYNNHDDDSYNGDDSDEDDSYYHDEGYGEKEHSHGHSHGHNYGHKENTDYENEYNNDAEHESDHEVEGGSSDYADDVVLADNWGYTDDEVFGDRKIKGNLKVIKPIMTEMGLIDNDMANVVKIQKHLLKPESEDDVMILLSNDDEQINGKRMKLSPIKELNDQKPSAKRLKPTATKERDEEIEAESVRNVLGSFMKDDQTNRRRQSANTKHTSRLVETPRHRESYYVFPANFW